MRALLPLALFTALASACTTAQPGGIDFSVSGGFFGTGDGTPPTHIDPDGTVTRDLPGPQKTLRLDPQETAELYRKVRAADFASLEPQYLLCCDDYLYVMTVQLDGATHTVEANTLAEFPERLQVVIDALREIARR